MFVFFNAEAEYVNAFDLGTWFNLRSKLLVWKTAPSSKPCCLTGLVLGCVLRLRTQRPKQQAQNILTTNCVGLPYVGVSGAYCWLTCQRCIICICKAGRNPLEPVLWRGQRLNLEANDLLLTRAIVSSRRCRTLNNRK